MTSDMSRGTPDKGGQQRDMAGQTKDQVQQKAAQTKDQVQQKAGEVAAKAQEQVASRLSTQKENAAQSLSSVASALRQTGQQLSGQDQMGVTGYIDQAADQVERLSSYLQDNDLGRLVGDVERFARRQPALFLGGAFLAGLLGARFLKASRPEQYDIQRYDAPGYGYRGVYGSGMGGAYSPGYGTGTTYGSGAGTGTNYGTGEVPGVYRPTTQGDAEPRSRTYGEPLEE
jgi:hypothetical protein